MDTQGIIPPPSRILEVHRILLLYRIRIKHAKLDGSNQSAISAFYYRTKCVQWSFSWVEAISQEAQEVEWLDWQSEGWPVRSLAPPS